MAIGNSVRHSADNKRLQDQADRLRITRAIALLGLLMAAFVYGALVGVYHWFPYLTLVRTKATVVEHAQHVPWLGQLVRAVRTESPQWLRTRAGAALAYTVHTHRTSYFKLDDLGNLELRGGFPYRAEGPYQFQRTIRPEETAIVVMDPWVDGPSQHLTDYLGQIAYLRMIPLVMQASSRGHLIVILTNDPKTVTYGSKVYPELEQLAAKGKAVMWYHRQVDNGAFASYLRSHGVRSLIYVGFSSNGCVIGREDGMISMKNRGFTLYFVPEASAAMEYESSWNDQGIHKTTTLIISQGIAEIIDYGEFMRSSN